MTAVVEESNGNKDTVFTPLSVTAKTLISDYGTSQSYTDFVRNFVGRRNPAAYSLEFSPQRRNSMNNDFIPYDLAESGVYDLLDEMVERDQVIGGTEALAVSQICGMKLQLAIEDKDDPRQVEAREFVRQNLIELSGMHGFDAMKKNSISCTRRHGFAVHEILYKRQNGKIVFAGFHSRHPGQFEFDEMGNLYLYTQRRANEVISSDELAKLGITDRGRFFVHREIAPYGNPYGESLIFPLRFAYYIKKMASIAWASAIDTNGVPLLVATIKQGLGGGIGSDKAMTELRHTLEAIREDAAIVIPEYIDIKPIDRGIKADSLPHLELIEYFDSYMQARLLGSQMTANQDGKGGLAGKRVDRKVAQEMLVSTMKAFLDSVDEQLIAPLVRLNFAGVKPPKLICNFEGEPNQDAIVSKYSAARDLNLPVSREAAYRELQVSPPKDEEDELLPAVTPGVFVSADGSGKPVGTPPANRTKSDGTDDGSKSDYIAQAERLANEADIETFAFENKEWEEVYSSWKRSVNMSADQLRAWGESPVSRMASIRPAAVIARNLKLLETAKEDWGASEVSSAKRTISFIARMKNAGDGKDVRKAIPFSKQEISLLNWAYRPSTVSASKLRAWSGEAGKNKVQGISKGENFEMQVGDIECFEFKAVDRFRFVDILDETAAYQRRLAEEQIAESLQVWRSNLRATYKDSLTSPITLEFIQNNIPRLPSYYDRNATEIAAGIIALSVLSMNTEPLDTLPFQIDENISVFSEGLKLLNEEGIISDDEASYTEELLLLLPLTLRDELLIRVSGLRGQLISAGKKFDQKFLTDSALSSYNKGANLGQIIDQIYSPENGVSKSVLSYLDMVSRTQLSQHQHSARNFLAMTDEYSTKIWGIKYFNPDDERSRPTHAKVNDMIVKLGSLAHELLSGGPPWAYECRCEFEFITYDNEVPETPNAVQIATELERFHTEIKPELLVLDSKPEYRKSIVRRVLDLFSMPNNEMQTINNNQKVEFASPQKSLMIVVPRGHGKCEIASPEGVTKFSFDEENGFQLECDSIGCAYSTFGISFPQGHYTVKNEGFVNISLFSSYKS
jgi:phage gp29-like protein